MGEDFARIAAHLGRLEGADAPARIGEIIQAVAVLEHNRLIGWPARGDLRELIIGRRSRGYVALYRYLPEPDIVFVPAIRSQRGAGYVRNPC